MSPHPLSRPGRGQLLMVVDDDDDIRETFADVLRDEGFEVVEAQHGEAALRLLQSGARPSLILIDQTMPVLNGRGFRLAQLADQAIADIPIVLMTAASAVDELVSEMQPAGVIKKPVGLEPLLEIVASVLASARPLVRTPGTDPSALTGE
jgi:CheY-like chemotaxis protein